MLKKLLLYLSVYLLSTASSSAVEIDTDRFIFVYKKNFNDIISSHLFSSPSQLKTAEELRTSILSMSNGIEMTAAEEQKLWDFYIQDKFSSPERFKLALENTYLDEESVRKRFRENLLFSKYFKEQIEPKLQKELAQRKHILELAEKKNLNIKPEILKHHFFNIVESLGGKRKFLSYLKDNQLSIEDIYFFIKTDLLEAPVKQALLEEKLLSDKNFSESFMADVNNFYYNRQETDFRIPAKYHFTQFFLSKNIKDKEGKSFDPTALKTYMDKVANELYLETPVSEIEEKYPELESFMMLHPLSADSRIYSQKFKDAILGEGQGFISQVIESDQGFHILLIDEIIPAEKISFEAVHSRIEEIIKNKYSLEDLETSIQI